MIVKKEKKFNYAIDIGKFMRLFKFIGHFSMYISIEC